MPSRHLPLIDPQELARRNNESNPPAPAKRRRSKKLNLYSPIAPPRPLRAVGFFYPERSVGFHDSRP